MEGQTFIRGRYMQRAQKGFFTIGTVAFGAQYLPANDAAVLVVEGKNSAFDERVQNKVQTWPSSISGVDSKGGGVLQTTRTIDGTSTPTNFSTMFAGNCTTVWGNGTSCATDKTGVQKNSVYMYGDSSGQPDRQATWGSLILAKPRMARAIPSRLRDDNHDSDIHYAAGIKLMAQ